ncbi:MAG: LD-carboxypeptidase [Cyanomargarita calcarea GSE-NOS-MK-12-04C]|jgi:muramoyltetrapeptide carboxypeptidase|uniref:LD-carboxypeptidase n=1 Tax=Cyanomargarita calcarea GSE-NOS-MK-12-04C TaxID=2839659 RepID=A0A951QPM8_9CYAN|nr:LD-carboxypeptidase [Cyanomargarita calcarea GSE-NOS-MK-12-04C]
MINRRNFLVSLATTASVLGSGLESGKAANKQLLKAKRLQPGSVVGIVSPASATFVREEVDIVIDAVRGLGLVPRLAPHLLERYGYLGGKDKERAADINQFFGERDVAAILPIRGGWGCSRILPYLDYSLIRRNPKILVGFSDLTALILGLNTKAKIITFHGPNGLSSWNKTQTEYFLKVLFKGETVTFQNFKDDDDSNRLMQVKYRRQIITPGKAKGKLIGGNLSVLSAIVGSPYLPDLNGAILFLEDTNENIYRIDRMMTHLKIAGLFDRLAGFIFGQCPGCLPDADYGSLTLEEVVWDCIKPLGIPAWYGATIGHMETVLTLPIGLDVEIDASLGTIRMLEPAVE